MALVDNSFYVGSVSYAAVAVWSNHTAVAGELVRQTAPAAGSERVFVCTTAGAAGAVEPTWTLTRGALNTSSAAVYQEATGIAALNGDAPATPTWTITATPPGGVKGTAVTLGQVIKRDSGTSYQICTIAGTAGSGAEPAFSDTAGVTTADNTVTWTSLGVVGNFPAFSAPHARVTLANTATWAAPGNKIFVADNHAETQASAMTILGPGTLTDPVSVYCVDRTVVPPTSASIITTPTASISTTGANTLTITGLMYFKGIIFNGGSGAVSNGVTIGSAYQVFDSCSIRKLGTTANSSSFNITGFTRLTNVSFQQAVAGDGVRMGGKTTWESTAVPFVGGVNPTQILVLISVGQVTVQAVDFSALPSGTVLVNNTIAQYGECTFINCKYPAAVPAPTMTNPGVTVNSSLSDSTGTNYRQDQSSRLGSIVAETTIVRTGGATDGVTPISWKLVTGAVGQWITPFESKPIAIWNTVTTGSITVTIYGIWGGGAVPNNDDIWIKVSHMGPDPPLAIIDSMTKANTLDVGVPLDADGSSTWGGSTTPFKMTATFTAPTVQGPIWVWILAAKASTTFYIDPKIVLT